MNELEYDYEFAVRAVTQASVKFRRWYKYHGESYIEMVSLGETFKGQLNHRLSNIPSLHILPNGDSYAIGNEFVPIGALERYYQEQKRIMDTLEKQISLAVTQWKANLYMASLSSAANTTEWIERGLVLSTSLEEKEKQIREHGVATLRETINLLVHPDTIHFLWEEPKIDIGMYIIIVDNVPVSGYYTKDVSSSVDMLREIHQNDYTVVYFVADSLTQIEEIWVKDKIKDVRQRIDL